MKLIFGILIATFINIVSILIYIYDGKLIFKYLFGELVSLIKKCHITISPFVLLLILGKHIYYYNSNYIVFLLTEVINHIELDL